MHSYSPSPTLINSLSHKQSYSVSCSYYFSQAKQWLLNTSCKYHLIIHQYLCRLVQSYPSSAGVYSSPRLALFGIAFSSSSDAVFIYLIVTILRPVLGLFSLGNRKKSQGAKPGVYGSWSMIMVLFLPKKLVTSIDTWAGTLSWCNELCHTNGA